MVFLVVLPALSTSSQLANGIRVGMPTGGVAPFSAIQTRLKQQLGNQRARKQILSQDLSCVIARGYGGFPCCAVPLRYKCRGFAKHCQTSASSSFLPVWFLQFYFRSSFQPGVSLFGGRIGLFGPLDSHPGQVIAEVSEDIGEAMTGINCDALATRFADREGGNMPAAKKPRMESYGDKKAGIEWKNRHKTDTPQTTTFNGPGLIGLCSRVR